MPAAYDSLVPCLKHLLPDRLLDGLGRDVGFIRRLRAIRASLFVWSVVLSRFSSGRPGFSQARNWYERLCGRRFCPRPFQMRFKSTRSVALFERAFASATQQWLDARERRPRHALARQFADIVAVDSTLVRVPDCLRPLYTGMRCTPAAIKACVAVSLYGLLPLWSHVTGANVHDMLLFPPLSWFKKRTLFLFDRGFAKHDRFAEIDAAGHYFLCPQRKGGVAKIISARRGPLRLKKALRAGPVQLRRLLSKEKKIRKIWDLDVHIRRSGQPRCSDFIALRLVILPGPNGEQRGYFTNLCPVQWPAESLYELYRLRWQIELVFKELKQELSLRSMPSKDPHAVKVFAWASLIALALSRTVGHWLYPETDLVGLARSVRPAIVSRAIRGSIHLLAHLLRYPKRRCRDLIRLLRQMLECEITASSTGRHDSFYRLRNCHVVT